MSPLSLLLLVPLLAGAAQDPPADPEGAAPPSEAPAPRPGVDGVPTQGPQGGPGPGGGPPAPGAEDAGDPADDADRTPGTDEDRGPTPDDEPGGARDEDPADDDDEVVDLDAGRDPELGRDRDRDPGPARPPEPEVQEPQPVGHRPDARRLAGLLERDARIAFTPRSASLAHAALEREGTPMADRAAALFTLGHVRDRSAARLLGLEASQGEGVLRLAALLALGELGRPSADTRSVLEDGLRDDDPEVVECALASLLRVDPERGRERARDLVMGPEPLSSAAVALLDQAEGGTTADTRSTAVRLGLRWVGARRFGTVDGRAWSQHLMEDLAARHDFLEEFVLQEASRLRTPALRDHLLELVLDRPTALRVRACVRAMPRELDQMIGSSLWSPPDAEVWRALLDESLLSGNAGLMPATLEAAAGIEALAPLALPLRMRQEPGLEERVQQSLRHGDPEVRLDALRGIGAAGLTRLVDSVRALDQDDDPRVRARALAVRCRLGDGTAHAVVRRAFVELNDELDAGTRKHLPDALVSQRRGVLVLDLCEAISGELEPDAPEQVFLLSALRLGGRPTERGLLRGAIERLPPGDPYLGLALEAMGTLPTEDGVRYLASQFPLEGQRTANLALLRALVGISHPEAEYLLAASLWNSSWHVGVLAAAVVREHFGMNTLYLWATNPPREAGSEHLRRLGFAIGELGQLEGLDELARRLGTSAGSDRPVLQGALLGALAARTH